MRSSASIWPRVRSRPLVMIKRGRYKFVHSPADPDQLYDLIEDPDELRNLAAAAIACGARARISRRGGAALGS